MGSSTTAEIRTVVSIGQGVTDDDGDVVELRGFFIDVSRSLQRDLAVQTKEAVERSAESRAAIEQAKGALMAIYSIDEDEAFALLTWHSQHSNTKLREVAATLAASLDDPDLAELHPQEKLTTILSGVASGPVGATALRSIAPARRLPERHHPVFRRPPD